MIFVDVSVTRGVYDGIKKVRPDALWIGDVFPLDTKDSVWLREAGKNNWIVLTRDKKIRKRPGERRAIIENGTGCFVLVYTGDLKTEAIVRMVLSFLDEMERLFARTPKPFIYTITKNGEFTKQDLKR